MNMVLSYLSENRERLNLQRYGVEGELSSLVLTPRFRASSHVVFLIYDSSGPDPVLVAKAPRVAPATAHLEREAANLRIVQGMRAGGVDSIPSVIAFEAYRDHPILLETALAGRPMEPAVVRRNRNRCCQVIVDWLAGIEWEEPPEEVAGDRWFKPLVEAPLRYFAERFPMLDDERELLERTQALVAPLHDMALPCVVEHGDLSSPNVMLLHSGGPGVVDWEGAVPYGLPACDLFFFLSYVAFAMHDARATGRYIPAFRSAFFEEGAWARYYVGTYANRLQLAEAALTPLFVLCWLRYIVSLLTRLGDGEQAGKVREDTAAWLRSNRYYLLWREAVHHAGELQWWGSHQRVWGMGGIDR